MNKNDALITWSNTFASGVKLVDEQHKGLVDLVNDLFNHATGNEAAEHKYFDMVIHDLVDYVKTHFATEEKLMLATKFSGYAEHKKAHESFVLTVVETVKDYQAGKRHTLTSISYFLKDWVLSHIAIMDKKYFDYFKQIATRKEDGRLTINAADIAKKD